MLGQIGLTQHPIRGCCALIADCNRPTAPMFGHENHLISTITPTSVLPSPLVSFLTSTTAQVFLAMSGLLAGPGAVAALQGLFCLAVSTGASTYTFIPSIRYDQSGDVIQLSQVPSLNQRRRFPVSWLLPPIWDDKSNPMPWFLPRTLIGPYSHPIKGRGQKNRCLNMVTLRDTPNMIYNSISIWAPTHRHGCPSFTLRLSFTASQFGNLRRFKIPRDKSAACREGGV